MYNNYQKLINHKIKELENRINELNEELIIIKGDNSFLDRLNKRKRELKQLYVKN